jgi:hypothetical protein
MPLCIELLTLKQGEESLGATWARFMKMATSGPPHSIPEEMLMQHFVGGLKPESTHFMNVTSDGSSMYKIVSEVRTILEKVLDSTLYTGVFDDPPEPADQPKENQQVHIISAASSPPPPYIEKITEQSKSTDHEPLIEDIPMFIPDLFTEEEYMELGNTSNLSKEHKCICSISEAFIPDATPHIEGLTVIMSKEWIEEVESSSSTIQIYRNFRILLCTFGDTAPQEVFYDSKVGANVMSKTLADQIAPEEPLTFSCKHLKWIDGQIVKSTGILHVTPLKMGHN